jgi:hypothetical protein
MLNKLYKQVEDSLIEKNIRYDLKDKYNKTALDYADKNIIKLFKKKGNSKIIPKEINFMRGHRKNKDIKLKITIPIKHEHNYGLFNPDIISNIIFMIAMLKKYKMIGIPHQHTINDKQLYDINMLQMNSYVVGNTQLVVLELINIYTEFFYNFVPYIIIWKNKSEYYFPKNQLIYCKEVLENDTIRFIIFKLTLVPSLNGTHANIIIYDKKNKRAERFETFGYNSLIDADDLDKKIKKYLEKIFGKTNVQQYFSPKDYLTKIKFQLISDDANPKIRKLGDPLGYCLAWTYWYLELRINNSDAEPHELIETAFHEIIKLYGHTNESILNFIRDYAKGLDEIKNETLLEMGVKKDELYSTYQNIEDATDVIQKINKYYSRLFLK